VGQTVVLGLGNILLGDEGVGVRVVERLLERYAFPPDVKVLDGGTLGLDLMPYVEAADHLLVIDALDVGAEPGTIARLEGDEIPAFLSIKISPHQMGLSDLLSVARLTGTYPQDVVLWGVQPAVIDVGLDLSPIVADELETLADRVLEEMRRWGVEPTELNTLKEGR